MGYPFGNHRWQATGTIDDGGSKNEGFHSHGGNPIARCFFGKILLTIININHFINGNLAIMVYNPINYRYITNKNHSYLGNLQIMILGYPHDLGNLQIMNGLCVGRGEWKNASAQQVSGKIS